jgi:hypothetical protein
MEAELHVLDGDAAGQVIALSVERFLVGRELDCQLRPATGLVSRHHCAFLCDGFTLRVRDLGSLNGTFVNGRRVEHEALLEDGDIVNAADLTLRVILRKTSDAAEPKQDPSLRQTHFEDGTTFVNAPRAPSGATQTVQWIEGQPGPTRDPARAPDDGDAGGLMGAASQPNGSRNDSGALS